jgi:hypothetical protein
MAKDWMLPNAALQPLPLVTLRSPAILANETKPVSALRSA